MNSKYLGHHKLNNGVVIEITDIWATDLAQEVDGFYTVLAGLDPETCWLGDSSKPMNDKSGKKLVKARLAETFPGSSYTVSDLSKRITYTVKENPHFQEINDAI